MDEVITVCTDRMVKETFIDPEFLLFCIGVEKAKDTPNLTLIKAWFEKAVQMRPQDEGLFPSEGVDDDDGGGDRFMAELYPVFC